MPSDHGQISVALSEEATKAYHSLSLSHRRIVDKQLRALALEPQRAPVRGLSPEGRAVFIAQAVVNDALVRAYRIDFVLDELMTARAKVPAIAVRRIKTIWK